MADALLTDAELDAIGADLAIARPDVCTVLRKPPGRDAGGAPIAGDWTPVGSYGCRVEAANRQAVERVSGGQFGPEADYAVALPRGTDVTTEDRIAVNGATLEVVGVPAAASFAAELVVSAKDAG